MLYVRKNEQVCVCVGEVLDNLTTTLNKTVPLKAGTRLRLPPP